MRRSCLECVAKHLGAAAVYIEEFEQGYPNYYGYVYGELDHAASEAQAEYPDLARAIREHRILWGETRKAKEPHRIPFEAMFAYVDVVEEADEPISVPDEIYDGLQRDPDGNVMFSADTRP